MLKVALIGSGAIAASVLELLAKEKQIAVTVLVATQRSLVLAQELAARWAPDANVSTTLVLESIDVVVEVAGHSALQQHVWPALQQGCSAIVASVGALTDPSLYEKLVQTAEKTGAQLKLVPGAIGAIDALAAAKEGGLTEVTYIGRKAPLAWQGTEAEQRLDLAALTQPTVFFEGTAREAAQRFPKNANVAATVALAGLGLDHTQVQLIADPIDTQNEHRVVAKGQFGMFVLRMQNLPLAANPKTSALTAYSIVRAIKNESAVLVL